MNHPDPVTRLNAALEGRYRVERQLGEGGMATVYLADDLEHERKVALKVLKPELSAVVGAERFLAEIKTTANLQHPHILPLHDSGEADARGGGAAESRDVRLNLRSCRGPRPRDVLLRLSNADLGFEVGPESLDSSAERFAARASPC